MPSSSVSLNENLILNAMSSFSLFLNVDVVASDVDIDHVDG